MYTMVWAFDTWVSIEDSQHSSVWIPNGIYVSEASNRNEKLITSVPGLVIDIPIDGRSGYRRASRVCAQSRRIHKETNTGLPTNARTVPQTK